MSNLEPVRVLVAGEVRLGLELARTFLRRLECEVLTASSGEEAFDLLRAERPELLVLDEGLGDMDGRELCRRIRKDAALATTVILMVGNPGSAPHCLAAGATGFLPRPYRGNEFLQAVRGLVPRLLPRDNERAFIRVDVEVTLCSEVFLAPTRDLSTTGLFVKTDRKVPVGETVKLRFALPGSEAPIEASAQVKNRVPPDSPRLSAGFGAVFTDLSPEDRERIERHLDRYSSPQDEPVPPTSTRR